MEEYSKDYFKKLANQIMFDLSDQEVEDLQNDFKTMIQQMEILNEINTEGVEPMAYPFENETHYLRDDKVSNVLTQDEALKNAPKVGGQQVIVPKVVR